MGNGFRKYFVFCNLKEAFELFRSKNFAELRPKEYVFTGGAATDTVCICAVHQNMKLMIAGSHLAKLTEGESHYLTDYNECILAVTCNEASTNCYLGDCSSCNKLIDDFVMQEIFHKNSIDDLKKVVIH